MQMPWSMSGEVIRFYDCEVRYPNFEGEATNYNPFGRRHFCITVNDHDASILESKGILVKKNDTGRFVTIKIPKGYPAVQWSGPFHIEVVISHWELRDLTIKALFLNRVLM